MTTDRQLVFGDDGSAAADVVWQWIGHHTWPGWRVSVVTATEAPAGAPAALGQSSLRPWQPAELRRLPEGSDAEVEFLTAESDPRLLLDSFHDAGLIAIGPRGRGVLKQLHIGSTAEWLLHSPPAPLVIVRSARPTRTVLLCVDGSAHARRAAASVSAMPWIGGCRVIVLAVQGETPDVEGGMEHALGLLRPTGAVVEERLVQAIRFTATFDVRSVILEAIVEDEPDLVAMGTRGLSWVRRMVSGSTATAVVHHARCSVLIARDLATDRDG